VPRSIHCADFHTQAMADVQRALDPASLQWHDDGELSSQDLFNLVCRLKDVEPGEHSNELWRLGQKYPKPPRS
jgi:hypothetical protein